MLTNTIIQKSLTAMMIIGYALLIISLIHLAFHIYGLALTISTITGALLITLHSWLTNKDTLPTCRHHFTPDKFGTDLERTPT